MNRLILILIASGMTTAATPQWSPDSVISSGNEHYKNQEFEKAMADYQSVVDSGYESAALYFNLGNACFKANQLTLALVNYERARLLDPRDGEIKNNLEVARTFLSDEIDVLPEFILRKWYAYFVKLLRSNQWAMLSMACFIAALVLFLAYLFSGRIGIRKLSFWLSVVLMVSSLASFGLSYQKKKYDLNHRTALILSPSVTVKSSPDENGTDIFQLHEGTKVKVVDEVGDWREIRIADGNQGWVKLSDLIRI